MGDLVTNTWMFVFLDESSKDEQMLIWQYGYRPEGKRLKFNAPLAHGQQYSMALAITLDGITICRMVEGLTTAESFAELLNHCVVCHAHTTFQKINLHMCTDTLLIVLSSTLLSFGENMALAPLV
jgi:hypothetical protein